MELEGCGEVGERECKISMRMLSEAPINLSQGFEIFIRSAAINTLGRGPYSSSSTPLPLIGVPSQMTLPRIDQTYYTPNSMTIHWDSLQPASTGGTPITNYTLYWDEGNGMEHYKPLVRG